MARLLMLSGSTNNASTPASVIHPRTSRPIRKFGLRKIMLWNNAGTIGGAMKFDIVGSFNAIDEDLGAYGVIELYDIYDAPGGSSPTTGTDKPLFRVPVSGKSRLALEFPGHGLVFKDGILVKLGTEGSNNDNQHIHYQLVGYEY